jgi:hypothetical protein
MTRHENNTGMRDDRDVAIVVLLLLAVTCVTILFLKLAEPSDGLIELLFPRVGTEYGSASGNVHLN